MRRRIPVPRSLPAGLLALLVLAAVSACDDEPTDRTGPTDPPAGAPVFTLAPDTLALSSSLATGELVLGCDRAGAAWRIAGVPSWAAVTPASGTTTDAPTILTVTTRPDTLPPAVLTARLEIADAATPAGAQLALAVGRTRELHVSPDTLVFRPGYDYAELVIANTGNTGASWSLHPEADWLGTAIVFGFTGPGAARTLRLEVDRGPLAPGALPGRLRLVSNAATPEITIPARLETAAMPALGVAPDSLYLGHFTDATTFTVRNRGNVPLAWSAAPEADFLAVTPPAGTLAVGASATVTATLDRSRLADGTNLTAVTLAADAARPVRLGVRAMRYPWEIVPLPAGVIDAEYDPVHDRIVAIGGTSDQLYVVDAAAGRVDSLGFGQFGYCLSIAPDGQRCVVGGNAGLGVIDLDPLAVAKTIDVDQGAADIVLAGNGWAHLFPAGIGVDRISCVHLAAGVATQHTGAPISSGTRARLHPSGQWIYGADNGIEPGDFEKYFVGAGTAAYVADSPYEGSYPIAGDLWLSDDGALIVVAGGWLFHASADPTVDMTYAGALSHAVGSPGVTGAASSTAADRIWILSEPLDQGLVVQAYEMSTTDYVASVALPAWPTPVATGGPGFRLDPVRGEFVFARPDGAGLRLLVQRVIDGRWGLLSLDAEDLP